MNKSSKARALVPEQRKHFSWKKNEKWFAVRWVGPANDSRPRPLEKNPKKSTTVGPGAAPGNKKRAEGREADDRQTDCLFELLR